MIKIDAFLVINHNYRQTSNISHTISQNLNVSLSPCSCICPIHWSQVENEDVVGAAPTGDAPTTPEWSTILLPTQVPLILEVWWYTSYLLVNLVILVHICIGALGQHWFGQWLASCSAPPYMHHHTRALSLLTWINPAWISYHIPSKVWDEFIHLFPNFNGDGATAEIWKWTSN